MYEIFFIILFKNLSTWTIEDFFPLYGEYELLEFLNFVDSDI